MDMEDVLLRHYGPLLSLAQLAKVLDRSAEGLRVSLLNDTEWASRINAAKFKLGRRVYFRTVEISRILSGN